jgi:prepilin-type N-terminal cleavage/methylation domain-containing protein
MHRFYSKILGRRPGFTLIELMIVVAIIGILATIAIPKFADLIRKSQEGATKGNLGSLRSAIGIYYADMEGYVPYGSVFCAGGGGDALQSMTVNGKYLTSVPMAYAPNYHPATSDEFDINSCGAICNNAGTGVPWPNVTEHGGWIYCGFEFATSAAANPGAIGVNCTHTDSKGTVWTSY